MAPSNATSLAIKPFYLKKKKKKQVNKGFVFPGLEKQAGPRMGLDFRS